MENKNEKTFADLFSSSTLNEEVDNNENNNTITFDNIVSEVVVESESNNLDSSENVSFSNIGDEGNIEKENNFQNNNFSFDNFSFGMEQDNSIEEKEQTNIMEEQIKENVFLEKDNGIDVINNAVNEDMGIENDIVKENILKDSIIEPVEDVKEGNSLFFDSNVEDEEINKDEGIEVSLNNVSVEDKQISEDIHADLIFKDKDESEVSGIVTTEENLFFDNNNNVVEDNNKVEPLVSDTSNLENNVVNNQVDNQNGNVFEQSAASDTKENGGAKVASVSPFFQDADSGLEKVGENILGDNGISFDQTKQVNSQVNKLDLTNSKHFEVKLVKKKVPLLKFIVGVISYAFFIFLVLILVTLLAYVLDIKVRAAKGDYSTPKFNAYVVLTGSMLPDIKVKDVVVTKKVATEDLQVGDIITFASSDSRFLGTVITHRIIKKNQDSDGNITFQTKGDNNNVADSALVQPNNIYGKVILKIPMLGYLQDFLATQGGWIICILFPCLGVISYDIVKLAKGIKKRKKIKVIK